MQRIPVAGVQGPMSNLRANASGGALRRVSWTAVLLLISTMAAPLCLAQVQGSQQSGPALGVMKTRGAVQVEELVREFLSKVNDPAMHDRFWADDLVYVGAGGTVRSKSEILKSVTDEAAKSKSEPAKKEDSAAYSAEDVNVRQFGDVCVLNFRLVASSEGKTSYYRNSGVFVERNGKWQAVSWQATKQAELGVGK
jgi:hypothetical protein